ncbi:MAG TPA: hypothetical protein VEU31_03030 [Candidatus Acidoferrales bacterium]|nr:hypothetical protein [Candidatus Acidoferrales bacterium]
MKGNTQRAVWLITAALFVLSPGWAGQSQGSGQQPQQPPPAQQTQPKPTQPSAFSLDDPNARPPAATAEEDAAYKAAMDAKANDVPKRIQLGEEFVAKYPQSRYLETVLSGMTLNYLIAGNTQKMFSAGEKALALNPDDVLVLSLLSQTLPRAWKPDAPDAQAQLDKAEKYGKHAIELTPNLQKPPETTEETFQKVNNQRLSMAHSGLGLANFQRHKYAEAIPDLEEAVKIVPDPDPVNYYVLGLAEVNTKHFNDAVTTFTKCAEIPWQLQANCKARLEDAKKQAATQLSAPK